MTIIECPNCNHDMEVTYNDDDELCWQCINCEYEEIRGNEKTQLNERRYGYVTYSNYTSRN